MTKIVKATKRSTPFIDDHPGDKWLQLFLRRHHDIGLKSAEIISKGGAAVTEGHIRNWFKDLQKYLVEEDCSDILQKSSRIFNLDETGVGFCPKPGKILAEKRNKNSYKVATG